MPGGGKTLFAKSMAAKYSLQLYDLNLGCGRIDDLILQMLLNGMSSRPKMLLIDEFDADQDGEISLDEFAAIMKSSSLYESEIPSYA